MKRYDRIILVTIIFYILIASIAGVVFYMITQNSPKYHIIEINRICNDLSGNNAEADDLGDNNADNFDHANNLKGLDDIDNADSISLDSCNYVKAVSFLRDSDESGEARKRFYADSDQYSSYYMYWDNNEGSSGVIRFDYVEDEPTVRIFFLTEIILFILFTFLMVILLYVRKDIVNPLDQISELPLELSKGHLDGLPVKSKEKSFHKLIWGIEMLRDSLAASRERELDLLKANKEMLLSLSHDIKTSLSAIRLYVRTTKADADNDDMMNKNVAEQIEAKSKEIESYVDEIMQHSREDILEIKVDESEFYLSQLIEDVKDAYSDIFKRRNTKFVILPFDDILVYGDIDRSREVIENIVSNAMKYGDGEKISINSAVENGYATVSIFNTGDSVSDNEINHIFDSFYRGSNSNEKKGSGLGLYICKVIMHKMNGEIFAEKNNEGMTFTLVFLLE